MNILERLIDFINRAERNYKYLPGSAKDMRRSIELYGMVMTDEERNSIELLQDNMNEIMNRLSVKFPNYSINSLTTFRARAQRAVSDYLAYGTDASKMSAWRPGVAKRASKAANKPKDIQSAAPKPTGLSEPQSSVSIKSASAPELPAHTAKQIADINLPLTNGRTITVYYPVDLTETEAERVGVVLKGLAILARGD